jgi:PAS domain S-box-containing protein
MPDDPTPRRITPTRPDLVPRDVDPDALLRAVVDAAVDAIILIDEVGTILAFNPGAERMFDYRAAEVLGQNVKMLMPEPYHSEHDGYLDRYRRTGERRIIGIGRQVEGRRKNGATFPIDLAVSELRAGGRVVYSGIARDLSAAKAAAAALRQSEESLRLLVEGVVDHAMLLLQPDGTIGSWNAGAQRMFGYTGEQVLGRNVEMLHSPDIPAEPLLAEAAAYGKIETRERRARADGSEFMAEVIVAAIYADDGSLRGFAKVVHDITLQQAEEARREALEDQLRQTQRLESVGQLAGGVAHDFNNLLSVVLGSITLLEGTLKQVLEGSPERDQVLSDLRLVEEAARRGAALTRQLLTFSRRDVVAPQVVDVDEVVESVSEMLRRTIGEHIELRVNPSDETRWRVLIDRGQLEQVLVNLAVNARDAMSDRGGVLTVETRNVELDEAFLQPEARMTPGPYVVLVVSDNGVGMEPEVAARAFEPFFTTKPPGSGTGLGLATLYGIVTGAGGVIRLYSEPGIGTTVKVYLPATSADVQPSVPTGEPEYRVRAGNEHILLVEDEPAVRDLARRLLCDAGYEVQVAADGPEALRVWEERDRDIDLVLTDLIMPGMSGRELAHRLRAQRPDVNILFMSGYTAGLLGTQAFLEEGEELIEKPFTKALLLRKVDAVLGPHGASASHDNT